VNERILVVDDEESIRFTFSAFLSDAGYDVSTAAERDEALTLLSSETFDLIFMDVILPGCSGLDFLKEIKEARPLCPVVIITGAPSVDTASEAVRLGVYDYVMKPIRQNTLLRITGMALRHKVFVEEKERNRANLDAIVTGLRDGVLMVGPDTTVLEDNRALHSICGHWDGHLRGERYDGVMGSRCRGCLGVIAETLRTGRPVDTGRIECTGHKRVVSLSCTPLVDFDHSLLGAVLLVRDETRVAALERRLEERDHCGVMVGKSDRMKEVYSLVEAVSTVDSTVLVTGESGTGKELVADAIHRKSGRRGKPYIKVNCSSLPENLLESELFGHVKGSFTGAVSDRLGRFRAADGGTIFLDEIGDIPPALQLRLLRVLQNREVQPVGASRPVPVDVRVIAATNRDLRTTVKRQTFREDLYYRLKVVEIRAPALRERREDIEPLVAHFLGKLNDKLGKHIEGVSEDALSAFTSYDWPGNVRELEHVIERALVITRNGIITTDDLPPELCCFRTPLLPSSEDEREKILHALRKSAWNKTRAARLLGMSRRTIYRKLSEHDISTADA
jgi:two-component system response regulator HydG